MPEPRGGGGNRGHTFLFREGRWLAEGSFRTADGSRVRAHGETTVRHRTEAWINEGRLVLESPGGPGMIENFYRIQPFTEEEGFTTWTSQNPALGRLEGSFSVAGDTILSRYVSQDGGARGVEALRRLGPNLYEARGTLDVDGELASAWAMTLRREAG